MDKNGKIPGSCLAQGEARKAGIWHISDETAVLAWRLAAASPVIVTPSCPPDDERNQHAELRGSRMA